MSAKDKRIADLEAQLQQHVINLREQADVIDTLCAGYRRLLPHTFVPSLNESQLEHVREMLDEHYPGRSGALFRDVYGADRDTTDKKKS